MEDDGPDEAEGEFGVSVDDVLAADVDQLDLLVPEEPQRRLHVLDGVETHAASLSRLFMEKKKKKLHQNLALLKVSKLRIWVRSRKKRDQRKDE